MFVCVDMLCFLFRYVVDITIIGVFLQYTWTRTRINELMNVLLVIVILVQHIESWSSKYSPKEICKLLSKYFRHQRVSQFYMKAVKVNLCLVASICTYLMIFQFKDRRHSRYCQFDKDDNIFDRIRYHRINYFYVKAKLFFCCIN